MTHPWQFRNDHDSVIIDSVYHLNEYDVPDDLSGKIILDVGAHLGSFTRLCVERGATVIAYEPDPESYRLLLLNTAHVAAGVQAYNAAVSDVAGKARLRQIDDAAGNSICWGHGQHIVSVVAFDDLLAAHQPYLVKLDCEGCEYPILESSDLRGVSEILCEFHANYVPRAKERAEECRQRLAMVGFTELRWDVTHAETGEWYRLYHGRRDQ